MQLLKVLEYFYDFKSSFIDILLTGSKGEETKSQTEKGGGTLMPCKACGKKGDHWTVECPCKDLKQPIESFSEQPNSSDVTSTKDATNGTYVPPKLRRGVERSNIWF